MFNITRCPNSPGIKDLIFTSISLSFLTNWSDHGALEVPPQVPCVDRAQAVFQKYPHGYMTACGWEPRMSAPRQKWIRARSTPVKAGTWSSVRWVNWNTSREKLPKELSELAFCGCDKNTRIRQLGEEKVYFGLEFHTTLYHQGKSG